MNLLVLILACSPPDTAPGPRWAVRIDSHLDDSPSRLYFRESGASEVEAFVTTPQAGPGRTQLSIVREEDLDGDGATDVLLHEDGPGERPPDAYLVVLGATPPRVLPVRPTLRPDPSPGSGLRFVEADGGAVVVRVVAGALAYSAAASPMTTQGTQSTVAYGIIGDSGCAVCVELQPGADFSFSPPEAAPAFDRDPNSAWCPDIIPASVTLNLSPRTSFSSSSLLLLGGNMDPTGQLVERGRVRHLTLTVRTASGSKQTAAAEVDDLFGVDRTTAPAYPARIDLPVPPDSDFAESLTMAVESAWPGRRPGVCLAEVTVEAIPWAANPVNGETPEGGQTSR